MRIFEDKDIVGTPTGMVVFADNSGNYDFSEPKGSLSLVEDGGKLVVYSAIRRGAVTAPLPFDDIFDETGTAYGVSFDETVKALNAFFANAPCLDIFDAMGAGNGLFVTGQKPNQTAFTDTFTTIAANSLHAFPTYIRGSINRFFVRVIQNTGKMAIGLYSSKNMQPFKKIWQAATTSTGNLNFDLSPNLRCNGLYFAVFHANNSIGVQGTADGNCYNLLGRINASTRDANRLVEALAYDDTLPATAPPMTLLDTGPYTVPLLFFRKS